MELKQVNAYIVWKISYKYYCDYCDVCNTGKQEQFTICYASSEAIAEEAIKHYKSKFDLYVDECVVKVSDEEAVGLIVLNVEDIKLCIERSFNIKVKRCLGTAEFINYTLTL